MVIYDASQSQPKAYLWYTLMQAVVAGVIFGLVLGVIGGDMTVGAFVGGFVLICAALLAVINYSFFSFKPTAQDITINKGMLFRSSKTINYTRIQNVDVAQGPIQMMFGLATVNIWTASQDQMQSSTTYSNGLSRTTIKAVPEGKLVVSKADAEDLRTHMSNKGNVQQVTMVPQQSVPQTPAQQ